MISTPTSGLTPFSGLSLIIHLTIIGVSSAINFLFVKKKLGDQKPSVAETPLRRYINCVISVLIILVITVLMSASFLIAIKTGIREGSREPQIRYLQRGFEHAKQYVRLNTVEYEREKTGDEKEAELRNRQKQRPGSASTVPFLSSSLTVNKSPK